jgi:serine/threonine protein kinase/tetratricopeptide (TPR) repeat protein
MSHDEGLGGVATLVDDTRQTASQKGGVAFEPRPGSTVGRYRVIASVGRGAMGVVVSARDPELDRTVAIKILHRPGARAREKIRGEAQALARLNHPNVVAVFDVGEVGDQTFVAMDFVEGVTLRRWLERQSPSPREILEVFSAAGRGLAAAHQAGLVHRDFKPDNVVVTTSGESTSRSSERVRVLDFGLAQDSLPSADESSQRSLVESGLAGTPRYMAPEQFRREEIGPAADQFAFCVALYEALWGEPPFAGTTATERAAALAAGERTPRRRISGVSRRVAVAIERGLSIAPEQRWPSMDDLLARLHSSRSRRGLWMTGGIVAVGLAIAVARPAEPDACAPNRSRFEGVWDDAQRTEVRAAFETSDATSAADAWPRVHERIDAWVEDWLEASRRNCVATLQEHVQSSEDMDARAMCLRQQVSQLGALSQVLSVSDPEIVRRAVDMVASLPEPGQCEGVAKPAYRIAAGSEQAAAIEAAYGELERCDTLEIARKLPEFNACAARVVEQTRSLDFEPLIIETRIAHGRSISRLGRHAEAAALLEEQYFAAVRASEDVLAQDAARFLVHTYAIDLRRLDDAKTWLGSAKRGHQTALSRAKHARVEALVLRADEDLEGALARALESVELAREAGDPAIEAYGLETAGSLLFELRRLDEAEVLLRQALQTRLEFAGPSHPSVVLSRNNLAVLTLTRGRITEALALFREVLKLRTRLLPHPNEEVASTARNVSITLSRLDREEESLAFARLSALEYALSSGLQSADYASAINRVADVLLELDRTDDAWNALRAAQALEATRNWSDVRVLTATERVVGAYHERTGDLRRAIELFDQGLLDLEAAHVPASAPVWRIARARLARALGRYGSCQRMQEVMTDLDLEALRVEHPRYWIDLRSLEGQCALTEDDDATVRVVVDALGQSESSSPPMLGSRAHQAREELLRQLGAGSHGRTSRP